MRYPLRLTLVVLFAVAMAYIESAVVVYLRGWFFPEGFSLTIKMVPNNILVTEIGREAATMVMLVTVGWIAGRSRWERFGFFLILFGVWDIFYYLWLKVLIDWPSSLVEMDILFLIPEIWLGPVLAPVLVSALMITVGVILTRHLNGGGAFRPTVLSWILALAATVVIYYSFVSDSLTETATSADYGWWLLVVGLLLYAAAFGQAYHTSKTRTM